MTRCGMTLTWCRTCNIAVYIQHTSILKAPHRQANIRSLLGALKTLRTPLLGRRSFLRAIICVTVFRVLALMHLLLCGRLHFPMLFFGQCKGPPRNTYWHTINKIKYKRMYGTHRPSLTVLLGLRNQGLNTVDSKLHGRAWTNSLDEGCDLPSSASCWPKLSTNL